VVPACKAGVTIAKVTEEVKHSLKAFLNGFTKVPAKSEFDESVPGDKKSEFLYDLQNWKLSSHQFAREVGVVDSIVRLEDCTLAAAICSDPSSFTANDDYIEATIEFAAFRDSFHTVASSLNHTVEVVIDLEGAEAGTAILDNATAAKGFSLLAFLTQFLFNLIL